LLPAEWSREAAGADRRQRGRVVADYIAGMTDKFALEAHERLLGNGGVVSEKS
jgi:dGTPase